MLEECSVEVPPETKPLDIEELVSVADKTLEIPAVLNRVLTRSSDIDCELVELVDLISADPIFAGKIIKLANSAVYSRGASVDSLAQAVVRLGRSTVHDLSAVLVCANQMRSIESEKISLFDFLFQSLHSAHIAQVLSVQWQCDEGSAYTAALFHNVGMMVLAYQRPDDMEKLMAWSAEMDFSVPGTIKAAYGFDIYRVSAEIVRLWNLPESSVVPIEFLEDASYAGSHSDIAECVRWSIDLAEWSGGEVVEFQTDWRDHLRRSSGAYWDLPIDAINRARTNALDIVKHV